MAKREKPKECPPAAGWLVTFSDLVTLLLTFFVLLLSMSSMDQSFLTEVTLQTGNIGVLRTSGSGQVSAAVKQVYAMMERPWEVLEKQQRIKDMLFPDDVLPPEVSRAELEENLRVLERPEGVALVFTDKLLFDVNRAELSPAGRAVVDAMVPLLMYARAPINVAGFSDGQGGFSDANVDLSSRRALAVLSRLISGGLPNKRFSLSAMGPAMPIGDNATPEGRALNRRVEILLKTARPYGGYS